MSEFMNNSKEIITNFLQTVVIIDDEAYLNEACNNDLIDEEHEELPSNLGRGGVSANEQSEPSDENTEETPEEEHTLNAKLLSDKFAELGLLCTALRPENGDIEKYKPVLKKADIVILDWKLKKDEADGETIKGLIKDVIYDSDENVKKSLRSIVIYSGEDDLKGKLELVKTYLETELSITPSSIDTYALKYEKLQIKIYAKVVQRGDHDATVKFDVEELVDVIIEDFVDQIAGLVPNMAIQSLAELRQNTHKILGVFSKDFDEAYLSHRALLPNPQDAESFMVDLFVSELQSILEDSKKIYEVVNIEQIMDWIGKEFDNERYKRLFLNGVYNFDHNESNSRINETFGFAEDYDLSSEENRAEIVEKKEELNTILKNIFENGYCEPIDCRLLEAKKKKPIKNLTDMLYMNNDIAKRIECDFSILSTIKKRYTNPIPHITLGTIIKDEQNNYFVCITPRCDAARVEQGEYSFPMLPLTLIEGEDKKFELIIHDDEHKKFIIEYKTEKLLTIILKKDEGNENQPVLAKENDGSYIFINNNEKVYKWVADIKRDKAQNISHTFAAQLSRVGFNESEYLRRSY